MADYILNHLQGMTFPGWEPERMAKLEELFEAYRSVTREKLWKGADIVVNISLSGGSANFNIVMNIHRLHHIHVSGRT